MFFAFPFPEFESVQRIKLIVSSKITLGVLFLTILYYLALLEFLSCNQLSHETYIDYQTTQMGSRTTATSKMELFANIFDKFYFFIIVTKSAETDIFSWHSWILINLKPIQSINSNDKEDGRLLWDGIKLI